jgi:hypothetical protein
LLLAPSTERFGGDIRVLTRLVEREHEAHTALGDSASLMGTYDVKAEEDAIRAVLAGENDFDAVVKTVDQVAHAGGLDAFFAELATGVISQGGMPLEAEVSAGSDTGVYASEFDFLADALQEFVKTPHLPPPNGVGWTVHHHHAIATLVPPRDLRQRLEVLPQSYLRARKVTESFKLALTTLRGEEELRQARQGASTSTWPEAHFLAPLHPIIDWAADRALAELTRDQIFAVRGELPMPTVLVQVMQTNTRGQVVAASYYTVGFPDPEQVSIAFATAHSGAAAAIAALGLSVVNPGDLTNLAALQSLIGTAVERADAAADQQADAIRRETEDRIQAWSVRTERWKQQAGALTQRRDLLQRAARITEQEELAQAMNPDRRLTRPLIVVVPQDFTTSVEA